MYKSNISPITFLQVLLFSISICHAEQPYQAPNQDIPDNLSYILALPDKDTPAHLIATQLLNAVKGMGKEAYNYVETNEQLINSKDICIVGTTDTCPYIKATLDKMDIEITPENLRLGKINKPLTNYVFVTRLDQDGKTKIIVAASDYQSLLTFSASQIENSTVFPKTNFYNVYTPTGNNLAMGTLKYTDGIWNITPAPSIEQIKNVIRDKIIIMQDNNLSKLAEIINDKEIIFLGEHHGLSELHNAAAELAVALSNYKPVVYASESVYGHYPFFEQASLYNCLDDESQHRNMLIDITVPQQIAKFNNEHQLPKRIMMTTLDVEHTIYHTKDKTMKYLQYLAGLVGDSQASEKLNSHICSLPDTHNYQEVDQYLAQLEKLFTECESCYSDKTKEEIAFTMEIFKASNRFQNASRGNIQIDRHPAEIRYNYFNKTIDRAYQKAKTRSSILLCRVGSAHICLDRKTEARHFAGEVPATVNKTISIHMVNFRKDKGNAGINSELRDFVSDLMQNHKFCYLPLDNPNLNLSLAFDCYTSGPMYDALLFVKQ